MKISIETKDDRAKTIVFDRVRAADMPGFMMCYIGEKEMICSLSTLRFDGLHMANHENLKHLSSLDLWHQFKNLPRSGPFPTVGELCQLVSEALRTTDKTKYKIRNLETTFGVHPCLEPGRILFRGASDECVLWIINKLAGEEK